MFIFEHFFTSKSFAAVREEFSNAYLEKDAPNRKIISMSIVILYIFVVRIAFQMERLYIQLE
jgi:hypothetical protein